MDEALETREFRVGRVLGRGFAIYFRNFVPFTVLALLITCPVPIVSILAVGDGTFDPQSVGVANVAGGVLSWLLENLVTAALVFGTVQDLRGDPTGFGTCISRGLKAMVPVIIVALVVGLIVALGTIALIIPGIIVAVVFLIAIPVAVVENPGLAGSLRRSAQLTKGNRWQVLGALLTYFLIAVVAYMAIAVGLGMIILYDATSLELASVPFIVIKFVVTGIFSALYAVLIAVMYHDLRVAKEGVDTEQIAAVFD